MKYAIVTHDVQIKSVLSQTLVESASGAPAAAEVKAKVESALPGVKVHVKVNESTGVLLVQRQLNG